MKVKIKKKAKREERDKRRKESRKKGIRGRFLRFSPGCIPFKSGIAGGSVEKRFQESEILHILQSVEC